MSNLTELVLRLSKYRKELILAYEGYLFQWGDFTFPMKYIKWDSYGSAPSQRQSLDAYTDENGVTHDNALEHSKTEIKFTTVPLWEQEWSELMGNIVRNYIDFSARDAECVYFDFELCQYKIGHFYFDKSFRASANVVSGKLRYNETPWTFIEY